MKTASWFTSLPEGHMRIGISRGTPRRMAAGYRIYKTLAPGPWFNSVGTDEYYDRYRSEILAPLNPRAVADELNHMAAGTIPVMLCYERPGVAGDWCHRAMAAEWLAENLGIVVPEVGFESLPQHEHPLMPPHLRRVIAAPQVPDVTSWIGRSAMVSGERYVVVGPDPEKPGQALVQVGDKQFSTTVDMLHRHFSER